LENRGKVGKNISEENINQTVGKYRNVDRMNSVENIRQKVEKYRRVQLMDKSATRCGVEKGRSEDKIRYEVEK